MPGPPVTLGCSVLLTPGAAGAPDTGTIVSITQTTASADGRPLAVTGSTCLMVNSLSGTPYSLPIGSAGASTGVRIAGQALVRLGDQILSGTGVLLILGPPAAPFVVDGSAP